MDGMRAEVREGWKDFPERQLLADLYRRAALRSKGRPRDKITRHHSRRPNHQEGLRVAKALVADIAAAARFDFAWESGAVSIILADQWASRDGKGRQAELRVYIDYSESSRVWTNRARTPIDEASRRSKASKENVSGPAASATDLSL